MYTIAELVALTGLTARTIRYCRERRLIPPPRPARGKHARYDEQHVARLRVIADARRDHHFYRDPAVRALPRLLHVARR